MFLRRKKKILLENNRNLVTKFEKKSPISEQYRSIRTNIQFSSVDSKIKSILVTSSRPSEGKSTTVSNLAIVYAQQGNSVLLVDADLRKPTLHYIFESQNRNGLSNVLTKRVDLEDAIVQTDEVNLSLLTSGPIPPNPLELLSSKSMKDLVENMLQKYDIVLFDTPPLLVVADAQIISHLCDGTILVVASGKTQIEDAKRAKEFLVNSNANVLGVVLNMKKLNKSQISDYYYADE